MRQATLLAAAHNAADSLSSGCALAFGLHDFPFWSLVKALPEPALRVELMTGKLLTNRPEIPVPEWQFLEKGFAAAAAQMPQFLERHGCEPEQVSSIEVDFQIRGAAFPLTIYEATIVACQKSGECSRRSYSGIPLKRRKALDYLGRVRKA